MTIAIDYDGTYGKYPNIFNRLREMFQEIGAEVYIVTARDEKTMPITMYDFAKFDKVIYTNGKAKASVVQADIFIDDNPITLCCDLDFTPSIPYARPASNLHQHYNNKDYLWHWDDTHHHFTPERL